MFAIALEQIQKQSWLVLDENKKPPAEELYAINIKEHLLDGVELSYKDLELKTGLSFSMIRHGMNWLYKKDIVEVRTASNSKNSHYKLWRLK